MTALQAPTIDDIRAAHDRVRGSVVHTPMLISRTLSDIIGAEVWLKFENLQFTAAYKERGALNTLLQLDEAARAKGVIAASAGNHAQGLAYHAHRLGIPATIVMPTNTPIVKVTRVRSDGFSNNRPTCRPANGPAAAAPRVRSAFNLRPRSRVSRSSAGVKSRIERKCRGKGRPMCGTRR